MKEAIHQLSLLISLECSTFNPFVVVITGICCHICGFVPLLVVRLNIILHDS